MKIIALLCIALVFCSTAALALHESEPPKQNPKKTRAFTGLTGIQGVSVEPAERLFGPPKPFGKPAPKRYERQAPLPPGYKGLGGIASGLGSSVQPCAAFNCKPGQYVVVDTSSKKYYRCYCHAAASIKPENVKCLDTPSLADRAGYTPGTC